MALSRKTESKLHQVDNLGYELIRNITDKFDLKIILFDILITKLIKFEISKPYIIMEPQHLIL